MTVAELRGLLVNFAIHVVAEGEGIVLKFEHSAGGKADVPEEATFDDVENGANVRILGALNDDETVIVKRDAKWCGGLSRNGGFHKTRTCLRTDSWSNRILQRLQNSLLRHFKLTRCRPYVRQIVCNIGPERAVVGR